jgi:hypothetical protein
MVWNMVWNIRKKHVPNSRRLIDPALAIVYLLKWLRRIAPGASTGRRAFSFLPRETAHAARSWTRKTGDFDRKIWNTVWNNRKKDVPNSKAAPVRNPPSW